MRIGKRLLILILGAVLVLFMSACSKEHHHDHSDGGDCPHCHSTY
ncbi:MAG: hypothetical protein ACOX7U_08615 [Desulfitobacteriia bacterium]|jgi:hypothetical protein